jgi:outer membrane protein assembly factor BamB
LAISTTTGQIVHRTTSTSYGGVLVLDGANNSYIKRYRFELTSLSPSGAVRWSRTFPERGATFDSYAAAVDPTKPQLLVTDTQLVPSVCALDSNSGATSWCKETGSACEVTVAPSGKRAFVSCGSDVEAIAL